MSDTASEKRQLRAHIRALTAAHSANQLANESADICRRLANHPRLLSARVVMAFWPLPDEVDLRPLIATLHSQGKQVLLPVVDDEEHMHVALYAPDAAMKEGRLSVIEPMGAPFTALHDIDIVLTPGRAFANDGTRMGRGRGYYDRFLTPLKHIYKIGVAFSFQHLDAIPSHNHDIKMNEVI